MGKLIATTFLSLDGVMEAPDKWQLANDLFDEQGMGKLIGDTYGAADALLLGRVTYQEFAGFWPSQSDEFAQKLNGVPKYVVSKTPTSVDEWKNSQLIRGDLAEEVSKLKRARRNILIAGSARLVNGLTGHGLIDAYQIFIHPVLVGRGKRLFTEGFDPTLLRLVDTQTYGTGVVAVTYERKGKAVLGT